MASATSSVTGANATDVVGTGRYILSFFLAGFIGLGVQYFLRDKGWLATWINIGILIVTVVVFVALAASASPDCYQTASGQIICP